MAKKQAKKPLANEGTQEAVKKDVGPSVPAKSQVAKKQIELSEKDVGFLAENGYTKEAWEFIGRKHGVDIHTRESIPARNGKAFLAVPKSFPKDEQYSQPVGGILTAQGTKIFTRAELEQKRNTQKGLQELSTPVNDIETTEEV